MKALSSIESGSFFRRAIFVVILISIFLLYTVFSFGGLTHKTGIDQAQVAREVARGNGLTTKFIRPISVQQLIENEKEVNFEHMPETFHSPLNILVYAGVIKMVGGDIPENYQMSATDKFYFLDQMIALTCGVLFLIAIGINYLLIRRIFDHKIASTVAIIMMVSEYMWKLTQSGLPQMLLMTLFSIATYLVWRAIEAQEADRNPILPALLSGFFFGLLALAHWLTVWIFIGYFIFAAFYFRPRGVIALGLIGIMTVFVTGPLIFYFMQTGEPLGTAFYSIHSNTTGEAVMRNLEAPGLNVKGILVRTAQTTLLQFSNVHNYIGGLILAPAFFISLLHPFKRTSIAIFRWNILIMWIFACLGMAVYGLSGQAIDPNQLHILFAPLMCAYGLAMMSIIWARCSLANEPGLIGNLHIVIIILLTATPMALFVKNLTNLRRSNSSVNGVHAISLNNDLHKLTKERDIIISDQPWATAWYADRYSIWTPPTLGQLEKIEEIASENNPIAGLHFSSMSYQGKDMKKAWISSRDLTPLSFATWISYLTQSSSSLTFVNNTKIHELINNENGRYKYHTQLIGLLEPSSFYAREQIESK